MGPRADHDAPGGQGDRVGDYSVLSLQSEDGPCVRPQQEGETGALSRPTRRRFLKWSGALVLSATTITGKLVGFAPTVAEAAPYSCTPYNWIAGNNGACFNCFGFCDAFQSCCRAVLASPNPYCCCSCFSGPLACNPLVFRAENYCQATGEALCCCGTCP